MIRIGYWRPLVESRTDRPVIRDGRMYWPVRIMQTLDEHPLLERAARYLREYRETGRSEYLSERRLAEAGVTSVDEYLAMRLEQARARAQADMALPVPVADTLPVEMADTLATWLDGGAQVESYRGTSVCRVCGVGAGHRELTRGGYVYPDGLVHYVRAHRVDVPGLVVPGA